MIGKQVGNYKILLQLGEDNLGVVFQAAHVAGGFQATLRHFAAQFTDVQPVARYLEIARAASALNAPGIWQVRETLWSGRNAFVAGEALTTGETLDVILNREGRLWPELVVKLGWQLAAAMGAAHSANIFHCRFDGDSVYAFPDETAPGQYRTKIMDFGVAAFLDQGPPDWRSQRVEAFGLPYYMAPEQCRGGMVDFRSDVYALGCLLFHMATGRPPFMGSTPQEIASSHMNAQCPGPSTLEPQLPYELNVLIMAMMAKEAAQRPGMPQVAYELERVAKQYWTTPTVERTVQLDLKIGAPPPPRIQEAPERRSMALPIAAVVVALAAAGGTLAVLKPWKKKPAPVVVAPEPEPEPEPPKPVETPKPVEAPKAAPPPAPEPTAAEKLADEAHKAIAEERWADATAAAKALQKLEPRNAAAGEILKAAKAEPQNKKLYDDFMKDVGDRDPEISTKKFKKIPEASQYHAKAKRQFEQVKVDFMHVKKAEAKALAETRMCGKIAPIEAQVAKYYPESAEEIATIARSCKPR